MDISDEHLLKRFGLRVPKAMISDVASSLRADQGFKKYLDQIMQSVGTMTNQDQFLEAINSSHQIISEIPVNAKVIQKRDNTFTIKAINSQNIKSLTQRAFFNSFNLQRNVLNDLDEQNKNRGRRESKQRGMENRIHHQGQQEILCTCGRNLPGAEWVQCSNEMKCRGSNWYHIQCAGFDPKQLENLKEKEFTCDRCKRQFDGDDESISESRKRIKQDQS